jgi:hypothetical protein
MTALCGAFACSSVDAAKPSGSSSAPPGSGGDANSVGGSAVTQAGGSSSVGGMGSPSSLLNLPAGDVPIARLHRLTTSELGHSLQDLLGDAVPLADVETDSVVNGFASIGASTVATSPAGVSLYEANTIAATNYLFADPTRVTQQLGCTPQNAQDAACLSQAIASFGRRAFRRPLSDAEVTRFTMLATAIAGKPGSDASSGLRHALSAILQSPSFLYRVELGAASAADGGRLKYTDFEMASRLAATLWDSVPDDALLDAAAAGSLGSAEGVKAQADRMLSDARSHRAIQAFADELYGMFHLGEATKDPAVFPDWKDTIKASLQEELERRVDAMVFTQHGDFLSLYDSKSTFVNNELARYYGLPEQAMDGFRAVDFPADSPRAGLLGAGAILAGHALPQRTSPTSRGKFVADALLCITVPAPPPNVPPLPPMAGPGATLRERLTAHRESPTCAGCHALMDPMGFGLENFDSVGLYRTLDNGKPVDASGALGDGSAFNGLAELGAALRKTAVAGPCLVSKLYAEAQGRPAIDRDGAALDGLAASFATSQNRVDQLLLSLVESEAFRFVEPTKG